MRKHLTYFTHSAGLSRRALATIAMGGAVAAGILGNIRAANALAAGNLAKTPGVKLEVGWNANPTDDDLKFLNEVGYKYVFCTASNDDMMSLDQMLALKKRYADAGITLQDIRYMMPGPTGGKIFVDILLDLPGRAQSVENAKTWIRTSAKAGFTYTAAHLMPTGIWESGEADVRGGVTARDFDPAAPNVKGSVPAPGKAPAGIDTLYFGRPYSYDEQMANFKKYFVGEIVPVLEESGVFIGFHPADSPVFDTMGGVANIMNNYAHYKAMFVAANSSNVGMILCCGTYNEGGEAMGKPLLDVLREFNAMGKYREVHFRNVSSPPVNGRPHFHETFLDNGYYDMYKIMKTLVDIDYRHSVHMDHTIPIVGQPYSYPAYAAGFMQACLVRAMAEPKGTM